MSKVKLAAAQAQVLAEQLFDAEHPGPILHDFAVVLEYLGVDGVKAAGKYNLLPIDAIPILDERLSRPLRLQLKRPLLKSHPYLQALHMLLRATALTRVEGVGDHARLVIDPNMLEQWQRLNPTEQYFTLLEAAFLHATAEMGGEGGNRFNDFLSTCLNTWRSVQAKDGLIDPKQPLKIYLMYSRFYLLAFVDLFGLMDVEHPAFPIHPWSPAAVRHTSFGDAIFTLLHERGAAGFMDDVDTARAADSFGTWQPLFQPYFAEWRENLTLPKPDARDGVFHFRASLGTMWRQIAIPGNLTLDDLAHAIIDSVDFDSDHLYEFSYRDQLGKSVVVSHPYCDEGPFTDEVPIGELPLEPGQVMAFLFDFGDSWKFNVKLEKIDTNAKRMKKPRVVAKRGASPKQYPDWD